MKKLMLATALVTSAAAFADPINAISFEGYTADAGVTVGNKGDTPDTQTGSNGAYFYFAGDQDGSTVKAYGGENLAAPTTITRPLYFASADPNAKYLELSTEGGILWRSINTISSETVGETTTYGLGTAQAVAADGTYLDTLVQFTPTEDGGAPEVTQDDKLAIWLNVDSSGSAPVTNLMVRAMAWTYEDEALTPTPTSFVVGNVSVEPSSWYRLTIKAIPSVTTGNYIFPAFQISIDGTELVAAAAQYSSDVQSLLSSRFAEGMSALASANKLFPSLAGRPNSLAAVTLQGVGFKGSGALDDIVWTEEDPFAAVALDFTLTWPAGVTPTSYTINGGEPVALALGSTSPFSVPGVMSGDTVAFTFTNADGVTKTIPLEAAVDATDIDASTATYTWDEYLGAAVNGAYTIDDANDLDMLRRGVNANIPTTGETFKQTANIDMTSAGAFAGIGAYNASPTSGTPFAGTYDGGSYKIMNVDFTQRNYGGVFNQVNGGTIKDLTVSNITCSAFSASVNSGEWGGAIVGNAGNGATLQNLVSEGTFAADHPATHNVAGIVIRASAGGTGTLISNCVNNATLYGAYTKIGGICAITQAKVTGGAVTFADCVNNGDLISSRTTTGVTGYAGILGYADEYTTLVNCSNTGSIVNNSGANTDKDGALIGWAYRYDITDNGGNSAPSGMKMIAYKNAPEWQDKDGKTHHTTVIGFQYATVADGVATTLAPPYTLAKDTTYLLEGSVAASETPVFTLAAEGDYIEFDAALGYTFAGTIAAGEGLEVTNETTGTVTKYWIPTSGGSDYVVEIEGSDVVITPTPEDLAAVQAAVIAGGGTLDVTDVAAVNAALAAPIGTTGIPSWQALFLGLPPTAAGLESFKIDSISIGADGNVTVTLPSTVDPKTGRGVNITLKLKAADTPNAAAADWTDVESASGTTFAPFAPGSTDTKKFYKVVVEFAGSSN